MKKAFSVIFLICLLTIILFPFFVKAAEPLVPCTNNCGISDFFTMLDRIYSFIVIDIAGPLAVISLIIGGICMLVSAGNPGLMGLGKKIIYAAIIGLVLALGSYAIINFILAALKGS